MDVCSSAWSGAHGGSAIGGVVTGGRPVTVYSPPMTGNRPELPGYYRGFQKVNPVAAQWETAITGTVRIYVGT
jgi:hypothetical protein